jgi:GNAT superfamily N-acetyltransferase
MPPRIVPATPAEIPALARVLARAFICDPMVTWPLVTDDDLEARITGLFELLDTLFAAQGWMHRTDDGLGVMALVPPDGAAAARGIDAAVGERMAALTPDGGARYTRFWAWIEAVHPPAPHWLLDHLAVDPPSQGSGLGSALLRLAIDWSEADGQPVFLETGIAANVTLYERFGFRVMHAAHAPEAGPHIWFMRRDPAR